MLTEDKQTRLPFGTLLYTNMDMVYVGVLIAGSDGANFRFRKFGKSNKCFLDVEDL